MKPRSRTTRRMEVGSCCATSGGRRAPKLATSNMAVPPTARTTYAVRQPYRSIRDSDSGAITSVPIPMPATDTPSAAVRRRTNQPPTVATIGTYAHATAVPTPTPYVRYPNQIEVTREVAKSPSPSATAPTRSTGRGPTRSARRPVSSPSEKYQAVVIENMKAVAPLPVPKSSAIDVKKAPKLYTTPKTVNVVRKAAATTSHARGVSTAEPGGGATSPATTTDAPAPPTGVTSGAAPVGLT